VPNQEKKGITGEGSSPGGKGILADVPGKPIEKGADQKLDKTRKKYRQQKVPRGDPLLLKLDVTRQGAHRKRGVRSASRGVARERKANVGGQRGSAEEI